VGSYLNDGIGENHGVRLAQTRTSLSGNRVLPKAIPATKYSIITIDRNCGVLPKTSNIHSRQMVLLHRGGADDNGKRRERASDDGAA